MRYQPLSYFERSLKKLPSQDKDRVKETIKRLVFFFETGQKTEGLGLKKVAPAIWEARVGLDLRVLFSLSKDLVQWGFVGTHDQVKLFLKKL